MPAEDLDEESSVWLRRLGAGGRERQAAERELHARLVRIALAEVRRRSASTPVTGPELDDVAHQAADDAMPFDCVGASAAGMRTAWVNRTAAPFDTIGTQPDLIVPALDRLPAALAG